MNVLITGGLGYIGCNVAISIHKNNHNPIIFDNLSNSDLLRLQSLQNALSPDLTFINGDVKNLSDLRSAFKSYHLDAVVHLAGLKSVSESSVHPLKYYDDNVVGSLNVLKTMNEFNVNNLIFSSSATVYGNPLSLPISEEHPLSPNNPYGSSKLIVEDMILSHAGASEKFKSIALRYFNPIGSDQHNNFGEYLNYFPSNLMPSINMHVFKKLDVLRIYGDDFNTQDGFAIRDFIHISDVADAHNAALEFLFRQEAPMSIFNIGTGSGYSVKEIINCYEKVTNQKIKFEICPRRENDLEMSIACPKKAMSEMNWKAKRNLEEMCLSSYLFYKKHPEALNF